MDNEWLTLDRHIDIQCKREKRDSLAHRLEFKQFTLVPFFVIEQDNYLIYLYRITLVLFMGLFLMGQFK